MYTALVCARGRCSPPSSPPSSPPPGSDQDPGDDKNSVSKRPTSSPTSFRKSSTATSTASPEETYVYCSPSCTGCSETSSQPPKRGLSKRISKSENTLSKRVLVTPERYGSITDFILREYARADRLDITAGGRGQYPTGFFQELRAQELVAAVGGLFGCTLVIVASQQGVWMSHFWEVEYFRATEASALRNWESGTPATARERNTFNTKVINSILHGLARSRMPGLLQFTAHGGPFHSSAKPSWTIVTPKGKRGTDRQFRYDTEVARIRHTLENLLPGAYSDIISYNPISSPNAQANTPAGKIVFQYDPNEALVNNPRNTCEVVQATLCKLWVESTLAWEHTWVAKAYQRVPGVLPKIKRDNPTCKKPSSLRQAPLATKGHDRVPGHSADPDTTKRITLGGATHTKSPASPRTRSSTPAPTAAPRCVAATVSTVEPPIFCVCGLTATYPTLSPIRGASSANCAYKVLPSSSIHVVTILATA